MLSSVRTFQVTTGPPPPEYRAYDRIRKEKTRYMGCNHSPEIPGAQSAITHAIV